MQTKGVIERFSVQPILMITYLHSMDMRGQDRRRKKVDSGGFNSILTRRVSEAEAIAR